MKLIQGALFVLLFLFAACTPHRCPIPDEMIGEHRIHRADGFMSMHKSPDRLPSLFVMATAGSK